MSNSTFNIKQFSLYRNEPKSLTEQLLSKTTSSLFSNNANDGIASWKQWLIYLSGICIVLFAILLFIHYTITPIFRLNKGSPGIITVPGGFTNGELYWKDHNGRYNEVIRDSTIKLGNRTSNYSFTIDIFIDNPLKFTNSPRILMYRSDADRKTTIVDNPKTLIDKLVNYNFALALMPDTTDLLVSVLDNKNQMQIIIIHNAPVQKAFRIGVVIMDKVFEVYLNGKLAKTKALVNQPKAVSGMIFPPNDGNEAFARVRNLQIWNRVLTSGEMRYVQPELTDFDSKEISGETCSAPTSTTQDTLNPAEATRQNAQFIASSTTELIKQFAN